MRVQGSMAYEVAFNLSEALRQVLASIAEDRSIPVS